MANNNNVQLPKNENSRKIIEAYYMAYFGRTPSGGEYNIWFGKGSRGLERALIGNDQNIYGKGVGSVGTNIEGSSVTTKFNKPTIVNKPVSVPKGSALTSSTSNSVFNKEAGSGGSTSNPKTGTGPGITTTPPPPVLPPEETLADKITKGIEEGKPGWEKTAYHNYLRDYGIEVPELTKQFGLPADYDQSASKYGIYSEGVLGSRVMDAQSMNDDIAQLQAVSDNALQGWENLKERIGTGELDPNGQEYRDTVQTLQQMTQAVSTAKRNLSASGSFGGGSSRRALGNAQFDPQTGELISGQTGTVTDPYSQQIQTIHSTYGSARDTGQSNYDLAMSKFLGDKKARIVSGGMEQGSGGQFGQGNEFGGGKWNAKLQKFDNVQWGLTPGQAKSQGLEFFGGGSGMSPYDLLIADQQKKQDLKATGKAGMNTYIGGEQTDLIDRLTRGY